MRGGEPVFIRGDANGDARADVADALWIPNEILQPERYPHNVTVCPDAADANDDGRKDAAGAVFILRWRFLDGPEPPDPGPRRCGADPTADPLPECAGAPCP